MTTARTRAASAVLVLLALAGCSFRGSVTAAGTSTASSGGHRSSGAPSTSTGSAGTTTSGTTAGTPTPSGIPVSATPTTSLSVGRCHTSELSVTLVPGSPGAGQRYATLVLENTGGRTCTVHGYGGIGLVDSAGSALPTHQVRLASPAPATVTLAPHGTARSQLHWSAVAGSGDATSGPCQPTPAALQVIPPDETAHLSVAWGQGPVCEGGTVQQQAYAG